MTAVSRVVRSEAACSIPVLRLRPDHRIERGHLPLRFRLPRPAVSRTWCIRALINLFELPLALTSIAIIFFWNLTLEISVRHPVYSTMSRQLKNIRRSCFQPLRRAPPHCPVLRLWFNPLLPPLLCIGMDIALPYLNSAAAHVWKNVQSGQDRQVVS